MVSSFPSPSQPQPRDRGPSCSLPTRAHRDSTRRDLRFPAWLPDPAWTSQSSVPPESQSQAPCFSLGSELSESSVGALVAAGTAFVTPRRVTVHDSVTPERHLQPRPIRTPILLIA